MCTSIVVSDLECASPCCYVTQFDVNTNKRITVSLKKKESRANVDARRLYCQFFFRENKNPCFSYLADGGYRLMPSLISSKYASRNKQMLTSILFLADGGSSDPSQIPTDLIWWLFETDKANRRDADAERFVCPSLSVAVGAVDSRAARIVGRYPLHWHRTGMTMSWDGWCGC